MDLYLFLWIFTIFGGVYKYYSYLMIPYILAENPSISKKDAFKISNDLINGERINIFKFQLLNISDKYTFLFKDNYLNGNEVEGYYPNQKYFISGNKIKNWLKINYYDSYSFESLILIFFTCSTIGFGKWV